MTALSVRDLHVRLHHRHGLVDVVRGISFDLEPGQITGMVGESGCGKSLTALALMGLLPATVAQVQAHRIRLGARQVQGFSERDWRKVRGKEISMAFQDPATALDPVFTVGNQLASVLRRQPHQPGSIHNQAIQLLAEIGFAQPVEILNAYPHELSGGMKQLVMLAMAGASRPSVLLADEPTTALDANTQVLVLNHLKRLAGTHQTAILLVSHDLRVLMNHAQQLLVMYCGRLVETGDAGQLLRQPHHPYSAGLLAAMPVLERRAKPVQPIPGQVPAIGDHLSACAFAPRCDRASRRCRTVTPELSQGARGRMACHHPL